MICCTLTAPISVRVAAAFLAAYALCDASLAAEKVTLREPQRHEARSTRFIRWHRRDRPGGGPPRRRGSSRQDAPTPDGFTPRLARWHRATPLLWRTAGAFIVYTPAAVPPQQPATPIRPQWRQRGTHMRANLPRPLLPQNGHQRRRITAANPPAARPRVRLVLQSQVMPALRA